MHTASKQSQCADPTYVTRCSTRYAAVQTDNCLKRTFVIIVTTTDDFHNKWKPSRACHKIDTFHGEQR